MISLFLSLIIGLTLLISSANLFYKLKEKKSFFLLLLLILGIFSLITGFIIDNVPLIFTPILIGAFGGISFRLNRSFQFFILVSSFSLALIFTLNYYILKEFKNIDLFVNIKGSVINLLEESSDVSKTEKDNIIKKIDVTLKETEKIIPFIYYLNSYFISIFCFYILSIIFEKFYTKNEININGIDFFRLNDYFIYPFICGWLIVLLVEREEYNSIVNIGLNVSLILSVLYLIQAIGIIKFYFRKRKIPSIFLTMLLLIVFLFGMEYFLFILIMLSGLGVIDFWADFRQLDKKNTMGKMT